MRLAAACTLVFAAGCQPTDLWNDRLERMVEQPRGDTWQATTVFPDGRVMQRPPDGTIAFDATPQPSSEGFPFTLDRSVFERGRDRYDIYCAVCHGIDGASGTVVAANMPLRRPPPLLDPRLRAASPRRLESIVAHGYGLMPSYAHALDASDRWAVVAYVRALQVSAAVPIVSLPADIQDEARRALR